MLSTSASKPTLLDAIYDKYSEINEFCAECLAAETNATSATTPTSTDTSISSPLSSASNSPLSSDSSSSPPPPPTTPPVVSTTSERVSFYIPSAYSPRKSRSDIGGIKVSISLIMSGLGLNQIGNDQELKSLCEHVLELDLSKNEFDDWNQILMIYRPEERIHFQKMEKVKILLDALQKLRLLNLSANKFNKSDKNSPERIEIDDFEDDVDDQDVIEDQDADAQMEEKAASSPPSPTTKYSFNEWPINSNLTTLILNACYLDLAVIESLLERMTSLTELHLASNEYPSITFSDNFCKPSLKVLYFNNNQLRSWHEVCKLGVCFPALETLVISENHIENFYHNASADDVCVFKNLNVLIANKLKINDWTSIDYLRKFPSLRHVRMQNIPLLESLNDEEKYFVLVGHLDESIHSLNGSEITSDDKENCERKYLRYFMDFEHKPSRYFELESKHGKLDKLADVNLEIRKKVNVKIKYNGKYVHDKIDVRQTVGDFKKYLEKYVGLPSSRFKVFYIDIEAFSVYGPEELKHANRCLYSFNVRDHDEFEIDLKPTPSAPLNSSSSANSVLNFSSSENSSSQLPYSHLHHLHFHHYNSHINNNSHYQMPSFFANNNPSRPISIASKTNPGSAKKSTTSGENSQQQSNKCCCTNSSKSRRVKPMDQTKGSSKAVSVATARKSCSASALPASLSNNLSCSSESEPPTSKPAKT